MNDGILDLRFSIRDWNKARVGLAAIAKGPSQIEHSSEGHRGLLFRSIANRKSKIANQ
jgi:hypothetical protein